MKTVEKMSLINPIRILKLNSPGKEARTHGTWMNALLCFFGNFSNEVTDEKTSDSRLCAVSNNLVNFLYGSCNVP